MHPWFWYGGWWQGWVSTMLSLAFIAGVVWLIVWLVRGQGGGQGQQAPPPDARAPSATGGEDPVKVVKRRYAAGEIDREEYLQKLEDLGVPRGDA